MGAVKNRSLVNPEKSREKRAYELEIFYLTLIEACHLEKPMKQGESCAGRRKFLVGKCYIWPIYGLELPINFSERFLTAQWMV